MKTRVFEYWLPVVTWLVAIFLFSTDAFSASETFRIIGPILMYLFPDLPDEKIDFGHLAIRKLAHITEYFILAMLAYRCFKREQIDLTEAKVKAIALVLLAALTDEWHQRFTVSRGASIVDIGYDCFGGVWALWLVTTYETWRLRSHSIL